MIDIFILIIICSFLLNYIIINLLNPITLSNKIIIIILSSLTIAYLININKGKIDKIENKFVKYCIIVFLLLCIYKVVEIIYGYGINHSKSRILLLIFIFSLLIIFSLYMYMK